MYSIELTPTRIHIVSGIPGKTGVKIGAAYTANMPQGSYFNGYIKDYGAVGRAVRDLLLNHNVTKGEAYFVVNSTAVKTKEVVVPDENRLNILSLLTKEMADIMAAEEHILDYIVYGRFKEHGKWFLNCMLYAVPKEIISEFMKLQEECGLKIKELDFHHNVISKLWELDEPRIRRSVPEVPKPKKAPKKEKSWGRKKDPKGWDKELEMEEADDEIWQMSENVHVNQRLKLWIGLYQDCIQMATNAIDGNCYSRTIPYDEGMQEIMSLDSGSNIQQNKFFVNQVKMFLQFISMANSKQRLEEIEIYGDYDGIDELVPLLEPLSPHSIKPLQCSRKISGISAADYPLYCTAVGAMVRR